MVIFKQSRNGNRNPLIFSITACKSVVDRSSSLPSRHVTRPRMDDGVVDETLGGRGGRETIYCLS